MPGGSILVERYPSWWLCIGLWSSEICGWPYLENKYGSSGNPGIGTYLRVMWMQQMLTFWESIWTYFDLYSTDDDPTEVVLVHIECSTWLHYMLPSNQLALPLTLLPAPTNLSKRTHYWQISNQVRAVFSPLINPAFPLPPPNNPRKRMINHRASAAQCSQSLPNQLNPSVGLQSSRRQAHDK